MKSEGYSGTPLTKKLGYKPGFVVRLVHAPDYYFDLLYELPDELDFTDEPEPLKDLIHFFTSSIEELHQWMPQLKSEIKQTGMIWVSWPKKASGLETTVNDHSIRTWARANGLNDAKVCAVDSTWSGLKLVIPRDKRKQK